MRLFWQPIVLNDPRPKVLAASVYTKEEILTELRDALNQVRGYHLDRETGWVDYDGLKRSEQFSQLEGAVALLHHLDIAKLSTDAERIACWLNTYNLLAIHAIIALSIKYSVAQIPFFFLRVQYRVGKNRCSLDQMEHRILGPLDPRTHLAVNFGSVSCAAPRAYDYDAQLLSDELDQTVRSILSPVHIHEGENQVILPAAVGRCCKSLGSTDRDVLSWCLPYLSPPARQEIAKRPNLHIKYAQFDYALNRVEGASVLEPPLKQQ